MMLKNSSVLKKSLKLALNQAQLVVVGAGRLAGVIDFPVPPNSNMRKTANGSIRDYYLSGLRSALPIASTAEFLGVPLHGGARVLDFGCGVGRQLLHLTRMYPQAKFHACDIDDTAVAFIQRAYPQVKSYTSAYFPPLQYEAGAFDLVYSVSIFSHLNPDDQKLWLAELARVTRPGGYAMLTTHGYVSARRMSGHFGVPGDALSEKLRAEGILYREYANWQEDVAQQGTLRAASHLVGVRNSYGNTLLAPEFIQQHWNAYGFEVVRLVEGIVDGLQDLAVLKKVQGA